MITTRIAGTAALLLLAGCSAGATKPVTAATATTPAATPAATVPVVDVNVAEWALVPSVRSVPGGRVTVTAHNAGTMQHEIVLMLTDHPKDALPIESGQSKVVEDGQGNKDVGEVEEVDPGTSKSVSFTLAPGSYVLLCNIVGHYANGMRATFIVT